jgi:hypothetical protein
MPTSRIVLTKHAQDVMNERKILLPWVEQTVFQPTLIEDDPSRSGVVRAFRRIPERDGRMLRVAYVAERDSLRILTVFFDRNRR